MRRAFKCREIPTFLVLRTNSRTRITTTMAVGDPKGAKGDDGQKAKVLKITAVGDGLVGKTCLLITFTTHRFPTEYVPTVFDNYPDTLQVDGKDHEVMLWDTAGQEDYERLRPLSYPNTDCFLLCYAINNRSSFNNISSKWCPELKHYCPNVPIILVATKADLRGENGATNIISVKEGKALARRIRAVTYLECSALKQVGLQDIFSDAVRAGIGQLSPPTCCLPTTCVLS